MKELDVLLSESYKIKCDLYRANFNNIIGNKTDAKTLSDQYNKSLNSIRIFLLENQDNIDKDNKDYSYLLEQARIKSEFDLDFLKNLTEINRECYMAFFKYKRYYKVKPYFKKLIEIKIEEAKRLKKFYGEDITNYEALLKHYDYSLSESKLNNIFDVLLKSSHLFKKSNIENKDIQLSREQQLEVCNKLAKLLKFDLTRGEIRFSNSAYVFPICRDEIKVFTRGDENTLDFLFPTLHELGHALYEQNLDEDKLIYPSGTPANMCVHESQSKFHEVFMGKSDMFMEYYKELFRDHENAMNNIKNKTRFYDTWKRTNSDDYQYHIHIMIRYEIERDLINEVITVDDARDIFNKKYKELLGINVSKNDKQGILQDSHWFTGYIGYFPTYTTGTLIAHKLWNTFNEMYKYNNIHDMIDLSRKFLTEKIYLKGQLIDMYSSDLEYDVNDFVKYLASRIH